MLNLEARILVPLARAKLGCGDEAGAIETADEAIQAARRRVARHHEAWAHIVRAEVTLAMRGLGVGRRSGAGAYAAGCPGELLGPGAGPGMFGAGKSGGPGAICAVTTAGPCGIRAVTTG